MRIGEVANLTGLNISNIRFYERKGLLKPEREEESKYRNYTKEDVIKLKQILLYRKMGISVETIYLLLYEQADPIVVLQRQKAELKAQMEDLQGAMDLCDLILQEEKIDPEKLDVYLDYVQKEEEKGRQFARMEEVLDDLAEYTKTNVFHCEPWIVRLFLKPRTARAVSAGWWLLILAVPLSQIYAYAVKGEELHFSLILVYVMIILLYGTGFLAFRKAVKNNSDKEEAGE